MANDLVEKIKVVIRQDEDLLDDDIGETIEACKRDLGIQGVAQAKITETDPLILRAIKLFCKAEYEAEAKEAERYRAAYETLRNHLSLSGDYTAETEEA